MKHNYQMPTIKVVAFKVEGGFDVSQLKIGDQDGTIFSTVTNGIETYGSDEWTTHSYRRPTQSSQE